MLYLILYQMRLHFADYNLFASKYKNNKQKINTILFKLPYTLVPWLI